MGRLANVIAVLHSGYADNTMTDKLWQYTNNWLRNNSIHCVSEDNVVVVDGCGDDGYGYPAVVICTTAEGYDKVIEGIKELAIDLDIQGGYMIVDIEDGEELEVYMYSDFVGFVKVTDIKDTWSIVDAVNKGGNK